MPTVPNGIIGQFFGHPDLNLLTPVLDEFGPYSGGPLTLTDFNTSGHGILPAGTYDVSGTYGIYVQVHGSIPLTWGFATGWSDGSGLYDESVYEHRFCQLVVQNKMLSGAWITTQVVEPRTFPHGFVFDIGVLPIASQRRIGFQGTPGISVDLLYFCLLA